MEVVDGALYVVNEPPINKYCVTGVIGVAVVMGWINAKGVNITYIIFLIELK